MVGLLQQKGIRFDLIEVKQVIAVFQQLLREDITTDAQRLDELIDFVRKNPSSQFLLHGPHAHRHIHQPPLRPASTKWTMYANITQGISLLCEHKTAMRSGFITAEHAKGANWSINLVF